MHFARVGILQIKKNVLKQAQGAAQPGSHIHQVMHFKPQIGTQGRWASAKKVLLLGRAHRQGAQAP